MKIAVVGASGNVGTAVLRALAGATDVAGTTAVARRIPPAVQPYAAATWHSIDIAEQSSAEPLRQAFEGVDAVIHLAWLIQPNRRRALLRAANVDGTARVAEACAAAGVPRLVVASSVGVYSPAHGNDPQDEAWPREGIGTSHYSVDKAAQEHFLDTFEQQHPQIAVARLRTSLVFQRDAAAEIQRLFLGPLVPTALLRRVPLPFLPLPRGIRLQAVHADDAAAAYLAAARTEATGPFNIAADDLLMPDDLAAAVRASRAVGVPPRLVRAVMAAAYRLRAIPADAGWLDMGMSVPVMSTVRAKAELGWEPRRTAREALDELVGGMREHCGTSSAVLRPGDTRMSTSRPEAVPIRRRGLAR